MKPSRSGWTSFRWLPLWLSTIQPRRPSALRKRRPSISPGSRDILDVHGHDFDPGGRLGLATLFEIEVDALARQTDGLLLGSTVHENREAGHARCKPAGHRIELNDDVVLHAIVTFPSRH